MARKGSPKLNSAAKKIGAAIGQADRQAHRIAKRAQSAKDELREELIALTKTADRLLRDLKRANKRLRRAFR